MSEKIRVLDPRGFPPDIKGKRLANRLESLEGKTVYLVDSLFENSDIFMDLLRDWFAEHIPSVKTKITKPRESMYDDLEMRARIKKDGDAAILGVGL